MFEVRVALEKDLGRVADWIAEARAGLTRWRGQPFQAQPPAQELARLQRDASGRGGAFTHLRITVAPEFERAVTGLDPLHAEERLKLAAGRLLKAELPRMQGLIDVRHEGPDAKPVVHMMLSPLMTDGGTAPLLTRTDIVALEARWDREVQRAFGIERQIPDRVPTADRQSELLAALAAERDRAIAEARVALAARMRGELTQDELRLAFQKAERAQDAWRTAFAPRGAERRPAEILRIDVEDGARFLGRLTNQDRALAVRRAVEEVVGTAPGRDFGVLAFNEGPTLRVVVQLDADSRPRHEIREALETRLADALERSAQRYDAHQRGTEGALGRVHAVMRDRSLDPGRPELPSAAPARGHNSDVEARLPVSKALAAEIQKMPDESRETVLVRALRRAYPTIADIDRRATAELAGDRPAIRLAIPERLGWSRDQLERPLFQLRFEREILRSPEFTRARLRLPTAAPGRSSTVGPLAALGAAGVAKDLSQDQVRAAGRAALELLSRSVPAPLRVGQQIVRTLGSWFSRGGE